MTKGIFNNVLIIFFLMIGCIHSIAAQKYVEKKGTIIFEASEKLFEPVKAENKNVTAILDLETNKIASLALMKGFHFKNSLMEEHFNENYIESETYPKATFRGKLLNFNYEVLSNSPTQITVEGKIALHGKEKEIRTILTMQKEGDFITMKGSFTVLPSDFNIEIPAIVRKKIAKEIVVQLDFKLTKK